MSEITLYLHIGSVKTGSTAIQHFLAQNFSSLLEFGVLYPNFDGRDVSTPTPPDYWLGRYFNDYDDTNDRELFDRCIQHCKKNSLHSVVISDEAFLVNWRDRIGQLAGKLDAKIKIICYVRRQDHYLESIWTQWGHKFFSANELLDSIGKEEWGAWDVMNLYKAITPWAKNFGKENIIIRPYEKEQLPDGILPDFLKILGVVWLENLSLNVNANLNFGFSRDVLEFLYLNKGLYGNIEDRRLYSMLDIVLDDNFKKKPFDSYGILSPKDRIALLERYELSNQLLAKEYLNREDGHLFYESWPSPDDNWEPYNGLNIETLTPILTKIIYSLYEKQNELDTQYRDFRQQQEVLNNLYQNLKDQQQEQQTLMATLQKNYSTSSFQNLKLLFQRIYSQIIPSNSRLARSLEGITKKFSLRRIKSKQKADLALIRSSGLFDETWYLANNLDIAQTKIDPLLHYLSYGGHEGRDPSSNFSSQWYLDTYVDAKKAGTNPLVHYLKRGRDKGYKPKRDPIFIDQRGEIGSNTAETLGLIRTSGLFDETWYLANYIDIAEAKIDPALHYLQHGGFEGRDPGPNFSSNWYLNKYKDVKESGLNPLIHYLKYGKEKGGESKPRPIIVHQMGKVGSKTVELSLIKAYENLGIRIPIYHAHGLNNLDIIRQNVIRNQRFRNPASTLAAVEHGENLRKQIDENPAQHYDLVSMVRDPIARNVASFFHNLSEYIPDWRERYADDNLNPRELQTLFLSLDWYFNALDRWFDIQMKPIPAIAIDVYETSFPHEIGYKIYPGAFQASLLLIRLENLNKCVARAMHEFLGLENFTLHNTNTADEKDYADLYHAFKEIPLPVAYVEKIYSTQYARHFYSDKELKLFTQRWTKI